MPYLRCARTAIMRGKADTIVALVSAVTAAQAGRTELLLSFIEDRTCQGDIRGQIVWANPFLRCIWRPTHLPASKPRRLPVSTATLRQVR